MGEECPELPNEKKAFFFFPPPQHNGIHFSSVACETTQVQLRIKLNSFMLCVVMKGCFKGKLHSAMFGNNIVNIVLGSVGWKNLRIGFDLMKGHVRIYPKEMVHSKVSQCFP